MTRPLTRCALPWFASVAAALAAPVSITNPSFESPNANAAMFVGGETTGPAGWTVWDEGPQAGWRYYGVWNPEGTESYPGGAPDGRNVGVVFLLNSFAPAWGGLEQTLSATLQNSTHYTLTVDVGNFAPSTGGDPWDFAGFPGYRVELLAGGTVIAYDHNTLAPGEGEFLTATVEYTSGADDPFEGLQLGIRLINLNGDSPDDNGDGVEVNFDRVSLDATAVPEPTSVALLAGGMVWLMARRRR